MNFVSLSTLVLTGVIYAGVPAVVLSGCGTTQVRDIDTGVISGAGALLTVEGLGCPMCAESIHVLLDDVDGVADSDVNLETGVVEVIFDPGASVSRAALASAVIDGGFSLRGIQAKE